MWRGRFVFPYQASRFCQYPFHCRETGCSSAALAVIKYCSPFETRRLSSRQSHFSEVSREIRASDMMMDTDLGAGNALEKRLGVSRANAFYRAIEVARADLKLPVICEWLPRKI